MAENKGKPIKTTDRVLIVGTSKAKTLAPGREYSVHPELAGRLVKKGEAEYPKKESK